MGCFAQDIKLDCVTYVKEGRAGTFNGGNLKTFASQ